MNERDKTEDANLIDYQGIFIIPTLHKIQVPKTNIIENISKNDRMINTSFLVDTTTVPRPEKITLSTKIRKKSWCKRDSIFKNYKIDTEPFLRKCFEGDFNSICGIIKDELDRKKVKELLGTVYGPMRECYKYYAGTSFSNNVPCIGTNSFNDLLSLSGIVDHKLLKLSDIGIDFIATNVNGRIEDK